MKSILFWMLSVLVCVGPAIRPCRAGLEPDPTHEKLARILVEALKYDNFDDYVSNGDAAFKKLSPEKFHRLAARLGPRLKAGYTPTYLGDLRDPDFHISLWKLTFNDGGDEIMAMLNMKAGMVESFWLHSLTPRDQGKPRCPTCDGADAGWTH
jgi:hypothetical protein